MMAREQIETERLVLRKPVASDADSIFTRYASDPEVTKLLCWPTHRSIQDTKAFLAFSDAEWEKWPAGPYLIESKSGGELLGSTGLSFESPAIASTGYVLARDSWGRGYATEALQAIVVEASRSGVRRLYALCHPANSASARVLEKCGFTLEGLLKAHSVFPNLKPGEPEDCLRYAQAFQ